jgi:copper chaperone CopZ
MRIAFSLLLLSLSALALCACPNNQVTDAADETAQSSGGAGASPAGQHTGGGAGATSPKPKIELATARFTVEGMTCADCSKSIENELIGIDGVTTVSADDKAGKAIVQYDASKVTTDQLIAAIGSLKFKATLVN